MGEKDLLGHLGLVLELDPVPGIHGNSLHAEGP